MPRFAALFGLLAASCVTARQATLKIRGVNLGGWLVLEKWIRPSLFNDWDPFDERSPKDEWTLCETLGRETCEMRLKAHWDSWVTEQDMEDLAQAGITHLRVPVGYWITGDVRGDEPYARGGQWYYLERVANWAKDRKMYIWLDMHAAPGSQNGFDNSGRLGNATWDSSMENVNRTLAAIEWLAQKSVESGLKDVVTGFGLLNEPDHHIKYWRMLSFYNNAYEIIRTILGDGVSVYIGDMFNPQSFNWYWHNGNPIAATNVYLDSHVYACFVDDLKAMTPRQHITQVCRYERDHINQCCWDGWPPEPTELGRFVGEWTAAFDRTPSPELERAYANTLDYKKQLQKKLDAANDADTKAKIVAKAEEALEIEDSSDDHVLKYVAPTTPERQAFLKQYVLAQMLTYEASPDDSAPYFKGSSSAGLDFHGWFFWNFKMEADVYAEWNYLRGLREGWIPMLQRDLTIEEQFGLTCQDVEKDTSPCTDNVVDPFPVIEGWTGVSCRPAGNVLFRHDTLYDLTVSIFLILSLLALFVAVLLYARTSFFPGGASYPARVQADDAASSSSSRCFFSRWWPRSSPRRGGYAPIKEFTVVLPNDNGKYGSSQDNLPSSSA